MDTNFATIDLTALAALFPHRVATASELLGLGLTGEDLAVRTRPGGRWQYLLPGILLLARTPPTRAQWVQAALRYAGPGAVLTGRDALRLHGMQVLPAVGPVQVLVDRPVEPTSRVRLTRTRCPPAPVLRRGFPTAPPARAAADAVRTMERPEAIRAVLSEVVHRGGVRVAELRLLLSRGPEPARRVLAELAARIGQDESAGRTGPAESAERAGQAERTGQVEQNDSVERTAGAAGRCATHH